VCPAPAELSWFIVRGNPVAAANCTFLASNVQGRNDALDVDPLFVAPLTGDFRLLQGSPMIGAAIGSSLPFDIDGQRRDTLPDVGADEFVSP
jgi:hypothetical protein